MTCTHGQLARVCNNCEKDTEIAQLKALLQWATRWVIEEIEPSGPCPTPSSCPWARDHAKLAAARALLGPEEGGSQP